MWFHVVCVGINDLDSVGAWVCAESEALPKRMKLLQTQMKTVMETTTNIFKTFESFSLKMQNQFENLNDRLTAISNQTKESDQSCTASLSYIHQDMTKLKTDMDKKSDAILSKTQCILDEMKSQPGPVRGGNPKHKGQ